MKRIRTTRRVISRASGNKTIEEPVKRQSNGTRLLEVDRIIDEIDQLTGSL